LLTFLAASFVVKGHMTLGAFAECFYIIGQMNSPVSQLFHFSVHCRMQSLSLSRLNEVQNHPEEEQENQLPLLSKNILNKTASKREFILKMFHSSMKVLNHLMF
jgi:ATP-binding cassette subfamily B protein